MNPFSEQIQAEYRDHAESWWFLSFGAPDRSLGVAVVRGHGPLTALRAAKQFDFLPDARSVVTQELAEEHLPAQQYLNRLLTGEQAEAAFPNGRVVQLEVQGELAI